MIHYAIKIALTSILVVAISEAARRSALVGALIASLPLTSLLAMIWLYAETGDVTKIAALSSGIFWLVLPSLVLFIALPLLLRGGLAFWPSLGVSVALTAASYAALLAILPRLGVEI